MFSRTPLSVFFQLHQEIKDELKKNHPELPKKIQEQVFAQLCKELGEKLKQLDNVQPSKKATEALDAHIAQVVKEAKQQELAKKILIEQLEKKQGVLMPSTLFPEDDLENIIAEKEDEAEVYTRYKM